MFADTAVKRPAPTACLGRWRPDLLGNQAVAVATLAFSFLSFGILKLVGGRRLRVTDDDELSGLDISQHEEVGYAFSEGVGSAAHVPTGVAPPERAPSTVRVPQGDLGR